MWLNSLGAVALRLLPLDKVGSRFAPLCMPKSGVSCNDFERYRTISYDIAQNRTFEIVRANDIELYRSKSLKIALISLKIALSISLKIAQIVQLAILSDMESTIFERYRTISYDMVRANEIKKCDFERY